MINCKKCIYAKSTIPEDIEERETLSELMSEMSKIFSVVVYCEKRKAIVASNPNKLTQTPKCEDYTEG